MNVRGRVAVVTGASRGFGAATARLLAQKGARVALLARGADALARVTAEIHAAGGTARSYSVDLRDAAEVSRVTEAITAELGPPEILINNAGTGAFRFLDETTPDEARDMIAVPYLAAVHVTRALLPAMLGRNAGHIVNVTSGLALWPVPGATAYVAACWAMRGFTEALRADLHGLGVRVTLLVSFTSSTPGYDHYPGVVERMPRMTKIIPQLTPDKVARAIVAAIERERRMVIIPFTLRVLYALGRWVPWLIAGLVAHTGATYRRWRAR